MHGTCLSAVHNLQAAYDFSEIPELFSYPVKNFGRFPESAKAVCGACALAIKAAGKSYQKGEKQNTALLNAGFAPTAMMNQTFFRDYLESGRTMGRGNLFIYTLPTSPAAEASIHFGLIGPSFFIESDTDPLGGLIRTGRSLCDTDQAENAICLWQDLDTSFAVLMASLSPAKQSIDFRPWLVNSANWKTPTQAKQELSENLQSISKPNPQL